MKKKAKKKCKRIANYKHTIGVIGYGGHYRWQETYEQYVYDKEHDLL